MTNIVEFPDLIGHTIKADKVTGFLYCATCEYPVCQKCKGHPGFVDDDDGARYVCPKHGFVCWNTEP